LKRQLLTEMKRACESGRLRQETAAVGQARPEEKASGALGDYFKGSTRVLFTKESKRADGRDANEVFFGLID